MTTPHRATGLPKGRPPAGGHPPAVKAAAERAVEIKKRQTAKPPKARKPKVRPPPPMRYDTAAEPALILREWLSVYRPEGLAIVPRRRPKDVPPDFIRMAPGPGVGDVSVLRVVKSAYDPGAVYTPHDLIPVLLGLGYLVEH